MEEAMAVYRSRFQPSRYLDAPYVMLGYNVFAADTDEAARYLATSWQQSFVSLRSGRPGRLPPPVEGYFEALSPEARALLRSEERRVGEGSSSGGPRAPSTMVERSV